MSIAPSEFRQQVRAGKICGPIAGYCGEFAQVNLPILPKEYADDFLRFRFPAVHGAPVHLGDPWLIGIRDLSQLDFGNAVDVRSDELPVFWACGVTPQAAIETARLPFAIAHKPGHMLVTDIPNTTLAIL